MLAIADGLYLYREAHGGYTVGTPLDSLWLLAALALAYGAWQPDGEGVNERHSLGAVMAAPMICGLTAIGVLAYGSLKDIGGTCIWLALATLTTVLLRLLATARENLALLTSTAELAQRDALTGLENRRALLRDLELALGRSSDRTPRLMLLFDLNGFKHYNDTFGHPAGDALLQRLARKLAAEVTPHGRAYRLGGDEFCALLEAVEQPMALAGELAGALLESGERFTIDACYGEVLLGVEACTAEDALRIADQRLYAQKRLLRTASSPEWRDVLLGLQRERDPELGLTELERCAGGQFDPVLTGLFLELVRETPAVREPARVPERSTPPAFQAASRAADT